jgi:hypothetical protein
MFKRIFSAALVFGAAAMAPPALAQTSTCLPRETLVQNLQANYGERLTGGGLQSALQVIEVWSSDETGSFTVFVTRADGVACIIAAGQNWHNSLRQIPPEGVAG